ncbi:MAG: class I SAM-dependent methyltransferase [Candidatus Zixiibacteriota bacterium]
MNLLDIVERENNPQPWSEGEKIPWNEPGFSRRMLREHLSQEHDLASHRAEQIDKRVQWIHERILRGEPSKILDLGCGPGFYTSRFANLGHRCTGIDFSPASIEYAVDHARNENLDCTYTEQDIRQADFGTDNDLIMLIFGELNVFRTAESEDILKRANSSLASEGHLLLEPQSFDAVHNTGLSHPSWSSAQTGLFSDKPHILLRETFWNADSNVAVDRYYVIDATTAEVTRHTQSVQAYTDDEYRLLLKQCGFADIEFFPSMDGGTERPDNNLRVILAKKQ